MGNLNVDVAIIAGAGFSHHAGLPLTGGFTEAILEARRFDKGPSRVMVEFLSAFIREAFDHLPSAPARYWPDLEDVFTCVDLSANSGHHLGAALAPADLRTVRRAILCRIIRMLDQKYRAGRRKKGLDWRNLDQFFLRIDRSKVGFISMNWDTVIERKLQLSQGHFLTDYCCDALAATIPDMPGGDGSVPTVAEMKEAERGQVITVVELPLDRRQVERATPLVKIHGSANWLYCDNCRQLFWFHPDQSGRIADQLIRNDDIYRIKSLLKKRRMRVPGMGRIPVQPQVMCLCSNRVALGTRVATFSYRKALDFPMFQKSWLAAEELLRSARKWVFIGYSLPPADFEFKYLLKRVQLSRATPPEFVVVSGGKKQEVRRTYTNYQKFFGRGVKKSGFFRRGLTQDAVDAIVR